MSSTHPTRPLLFVLVIALLAILLVPVSGANAQGKSKKATKAASCLGADLMPSAENIAQIKSATRCLLNVERTKRGLKALSVNGHLTEAAEDYSGQMVRDQFFDHVSPSGSTLLSRIRSTTGYLTGARSYSLGENLAWGSGNRATPRETVVAWMNSAGHKRNILDRNFKQIGIGIAIGAPTAVEGDAATYTTEFGRRS